MPQSSGQRQGCFRNRPEIAHSVSPRFTVYSSGALGLISAKGTPAFATWAAVVLWLAVMGKPWAKTVLESAIAPPMKAVRAIAALDLAIMSCVIA